MNGCSSVWKHIEQLPFLNPVTTCDILMSRSRIYIPLPIALKVNNTYRHHLVQVSPACLRKNRRPARGQMQKFAVKMRSKSSQQRTTKLCCKLWVSSRVKRLFPSGHGTLRSQGVRCAKQNYYKQRKKRRAPPAFYLLYKAPPRALNIHRLTWLKRCTVQLQLQWHIIIRLHTPLKTRSGTVLIHLLQ